MGQLCILYYKHGWDTYLTCSADLCKHTSGCSANKSRLYCPLTSAELLIANVTQRRASTVDWGSLSLTSWLTAANAPLIYPKTWNTHTTTRAQHAILSSTVRCTGLPASGRLVNRRLGRFTSFRQLRVRNFHKEEDKYGWGAWGKSHEAFKQIWTKNVSLGMSVSKLWFKFYSNNAKSKCVAIGDIPITSVI